MIGVRVAVGEVGKRKKDYEIEQKVGESTNNSSDGGSGSGSGSGCWNWKPSCGILGQRQCGDEQAAAVAAVAERLRWAGTQSSIWLTFPRSEGCLQSYSQDERPN